MNFMQSQGLRKYKISDNPGVYFFRKGKNIIYIGKATSLRDRVKSYFGKDLIETRGPLLVDMVFQANKLDWQETDSVLEALILEATLIKKYQPKYNTKEKSDKSFNYVCITKESFPKVLIIRERGISEKFKNIKLQAKYGPFTNGSQLRDAMKIIRNIFPFIDVQSAKRDNFEFYRQLGLTPDTGTKEAQVAYNKNITNLKLFFQGKKKRIIFNLKKEMALYAKNREFEHANEIKKRIFALMHINDIALIKNSLETRTFGLEPNFRIEAYDIAHMGGKSMVGVMTVVEDGEVVKNEYKKFKIRTQLRSNDTGALEEVLLRRFRHSEWGLPDLVVVDGGVAQINVAKKTLSFYKYKIPIVSVVKDDKHKAKAIMGDEDISKKHKKSILLSNSEAHRFAITYHKNMRSKNFLK
jgi:excinuclease ABC subunit C